MLINKFNIKFVLYLVGAKVILACRNTDKADKAAAEIREATGSSLVLVHKLNLASTASIRDFAEKILKEEDRLDILINNAGKSTKQRWPNDANMIVLRLHDTVMTEVVRTVTLIG